MAGDRGWPEVSAITAESCSLSCSFGLLKGPEYTGKRIRAAIASPSPATAQPLACV